ncbi:WD repeat-containing protein 82 [Larimichthys crocea]|uniref:Uncharacterized protein n=1 Tax=Larimichthys crocea TaxID=215358 RepID=A0ACD3RJQ6_LARCR|nr:WD repeat-containing protein 82 [Larimichthys crocea]
MVKLYDLRSFDKGPFATFKLQYDRTCEWTGLKFSNDGKLILLSTNGGALRILDAFKGAVLHSFGGYNNSKGVTLEASFTPDSQFVMIGSEDGKIHVWNAESGNEGGVIRREAHGTNNLSAVQPQVHDVCKCLLQHGVLAPHHR